MSTFALHAVGPRISFWQPLRRLAWRTAAVRTLPFPRRTHTTAVSDVTPSSATSRDAEFARVALPWLPDVARFARSLTRDEQAADDLVQETFLRAWRHWDTFRAGSEARAWLFTIARNAWHKTGRKDARYVPVEDEALEAFAGEDYPMAAPREMTDALSRADLGPAIREAIDALPAAFRDVVELVDLQELPYQEAASVLGIPIGTVRSRLFRARRLLQEALVEHARDLGLVAASDTEASA